MCMCYSQTGKCWECDLHQCSGMNLQNSQLKQHWRQTFVDYNISIFAQKNLTTLQHTLHTAILVKQNQYDII